MRTSRVWRAVLLVAFLFLAAALPAPLEAAILTVTNCGDSGSGGQLRQVVTGATAGDTVLLPACTITLGGTLTLEPEHLAVGSRGRRHGPQRRRTDPVLLDRRGHLGQPHRAQHPERQRGVRRGLGQLRDHRPDQRGGERQHGDHPRRHRESVRRDPDPARQRGHRQRLAAERRRHRQLRSAHPAQHHRRRQPGADTRRRHPERGHARRGQQHHRQQLGGDGRRRLQRHAAATSRSRTPSSPTTRRRRSARTAACWAR